MNKLIFCAAILFAVAQRCRAQSDSTEKANEIIKLEQALADALPADSGLWNKYTDEHWYITLEDGSGQTKKAFLAGFAPFPRQVSGNIKVTQPVFCFYGNIAVIHYVADEHENAYGQLLHTTYATSDVWYRKGQTWMMLSMQNFEIPALPPVIKVDRQILQQYTGTYRLNDDNIAHVTINQDTLYLQKGDGKPQPLLPETSNVFFRPNDTRGRRLFVKAEGGQMLMLARRNGQDLVWKKL